jgi:formylglycine-generating enzyme required for sulfatase activity
MAAGSGSTHSAQGSHGTVRLDTLRQQTGSEPGEVIPVFAALIRRLREIHAADLSHPELSPRNIRLNGQSVDIDTFPRPAAQATVLVADAKYTAPELLITQTVPDQAAHVCADIYVLGFLLYELLIGREQMDRQFADLAELNTGLGWMRWHTDPAQRLQPLAAVVPDAPKTLSDLLERMLEKDASKRIRTFEEVEQAFDSLSARFRKTEEIKVAPAVRPGRKRRRVGRGTGVLLMLGLLAAAAWWLYPAWWRPLTNLPGVRWAFQAARVPGPETSPQPDSGPPRVLHTPTGAMVLVPGGEFLMGDNALPVASPAHKVTIGPFYIDRLEVSNGAYREFCARMRRTLPSPPAFDAEYVSKPDYPAVNVNWDDAQAFCQSAGKRLPSEAEWEKAARGTEDPSIIWGNWNVPGLANIPGAAGRPAPGGSFPADVSPFGVLDMAGNVQEWVADEYRLYDGNSGTLSAADSGQRLVRGASFAHLPPRLSPAWRGLPPAGTSGLNLNTVGFRCAADVTAATAYSQPVR